MIREEEEGRITTDDECMMNDFFFFLPTEVGMGDSVMGNLAAPMVVT